MEYLLKKYLWVGHIFLVVLIGWYVGSSVSDYLGRKYLRTPFLTLADVEKHLAALRVEGAEEEEDGGLSGEELARRNVFNVERFELLLEEEEFDGEDGEGEEEEGPLDTGGEDGFEDAEIDAQLVGTMVARESDDCMALIKEGQVMKLFRVGMTLAEKAEIMAIKKKFVVVKVDNKLQVLKLGAEPKADKKGPELAKRGRGGRPVPPGPSKAKAKGKANYKDWIKRTSANEYNIDRTMLMEELNDLSKLGTQARVVPNYKGGKYEGFKLIGVRPNSLYRAIGIRSGDIVKEVNGHELNSPNKAIKLFDELKTESAIAVQVERGGRAVQLHYKVTQ